MPSDNTINRILDFVSRLDGIDPAVFKEGLEIVRLHHQIERVIENESARWGVTARQLDILESLYHNPEGTMTPAALADDVGLTRSAMTSALDCLARLGHVERTRHPSDRRMVVVGLTPPGREFIQARLPERYRRFYRLITSISAMERAGHLQMHRRILELLIREMQPAHAEKVPPEKSV